jgi:hypothetical protein
VNDVSSKLFGVLIALSCVAALLTILSARVWRRFANRPVTPIGSLKTGPSEVQGKLRAKGDAVTTFAGTAAVAVKRELSYSYKSGSRVYASKLVVDVDVMAGEIEDATGTCSVEGDPVAIIGPIRTYRWPAGEFATKWPILFAKLGIEGTLEVLHVGARETVIADGDVALVAGQAEPDGTMIETDDYRGARERMHLVAPEGRALLLSAWNRDAANAVFRQPVILAAWVAVLALATAALLVGAAAYVHHVAGL